MSSAEQHLQRLYRQLAPGDQVTLIAFAEFLRERADGTATVNSPSPAEVAEPEPIRRPREERVIAALKRLSRTYPMLDKGTMLNATSEIVARHIMAGDDAPAVIDTLEEIFRQEYEKLKHGQGD
jgi:hypothetical protein